MHKPNPRCRQSPPCFGELCGHCPTCGEVWDNHASLSIEPGLVEFTTCRSGKQPKKP